MNSCFLILLVFFLLLTLCAAQSQLEIHKRTKRMRILTDRYSRTPHADGLYEAMFGAERMEELFTRSDDGILTIREEGDGVKYDGKTYYWYGLIYSYWNKKSRTCYYPVGDDEEMRNVRFTDGSKVKWLMFGCWSWQRCCGTDCCFEYALFGTILLLLLLGSCLAAYCKLRRSRNRDTVDQVEVPLNEVQQPVN